ncbi:MAG: DUF1570 domain-containing protein [Planctomycetota bacterium]
MVASRWALRSAVYSMTGAAVWLLLSVQGWVAPGSSARGQGGVAPALAQSETQQRAVVVLKDGTELTGEIIEETDETIVLRSAFGRSTIQKSRIKEIKRGTNPLREEFEERYVRAATSVTQLFQLAQWALENNLVVEQRRALGKILELDPNHQGARKALGHARLDGVWLDEQRVVELLRQGYALEGLELVKKAGAGGTGAGASGSGTNPGGTGGAGAGPAPTPQPTIKRERRELTPAEKAAAEKAREANRKAAEKYRRKKELEYKGVPWEKAWKIRSEVYDVTCNSTKEVADTYRVIMDGLYAKLITRLQQRQVRGGRMPVFIYRNREEFLLRTGQREGVGGFYNRITQELHGYHGTFGLTGSTFSVLAHEGTHQVQGRVLGAQRMAELPIWLIEGTAVYFGDGAKLDYRKKDIVTGLIPRDRLFHIQDKMRKGTHEPLRTLIALPQARYGGSQYADGWSLVHFLFNDKEGYKLIGAYWLAGSERRVTATDFVTLAERHFGSMEELERKWIQHTLALVPEDAGTVEDDGYFSSDDFGFEIRLPAPDWEFVLNTGDNATLVKMVLPGTDAAIEVRFLNNDAAADPNVYVDGVVKAAQATYGEVVRAKTTINGLSGFVLDYSDPVPAPPKKEDPKAEPKGDEPKGAGPGGPEPAGGGEAAKPEVPVDQVKGPRKRYRSYLIVDLTKAVIVRCSVRFEDFTALEGDFQAAADSLELVSRNRW